MPSQLSEQLPEPVPQHVGQPCWRKENVAEAIKVVARTSLDVRSRHYFLATHSPVERIWDDLGGTLISERDLFDRLLDPVHANVLALVQGEPGSGKSHLIRWLHLRLELEREECRLQEIVPVLVQRRTGSLKDALEQILQQLPAEFERHLGHLKEAIGNISDATAREMLASQLQLELGPRWAERGGATLPAPLRQLNAVCLSAGFRKWLCRDGGVIDANIRRLTQPSDALERESLPEFNAAEFDLPRSSADYRADNVDAVRRLIDEFDEFASTREQAAALFNRALRYAIKEMSGLGGTRLRDVFDAVRADLRRQGKSLVLFIEDISVMSSLDEDIFNAVEPQDRNDLCRLIAVLGVVTLSQQRERQLRENQLSRVTHKVSVGGEVTTLWRGDSGTVARFTARYLNAARLAETGVTRLARQRRDGGDVSFSACTNCPVRKPCHERFGKVSFDDVDVGLFPLTDAAPQALLARLDEHVEGVRKNQRGLLERILRPVLGDADALEEGTFPSMRLPIVLSQPSYWTAFEEQYCGGWSYEDRERAKLLCQAWVKADTADGAAAVLDPLRETFRLPQFSRKAGEPHKGGKKDGEGGGEEEGPKSYISPNLQKILDCLAVWVADGRLTDDTEPRELLQQFIRDGVPWYDHRLPAGLGQKLFSERSAVTFDGQRSKVPAGRFTLRFPLPGGGGDERARRHQVSRVVEALARFRYEGKNSWAFARGEAHKRVASTWLRQHEAQLVRVCDPPEEIDRAQPIAHALRFLAVAALMRRRVAFPTTPAAVLRELLTPLVSPPAALTNDEAALAEELRTKFSAVRDFVLSELNVSQGPGGGINFIDPLPIFDLLLRGGIDDLDPAPLPQEYFSGYWKSRYQSLDDLPRFHRLAATLEGKRAEIQTRLAMLRATMIDAGVEAENLPMLVKAYCADFVELLKAQSDVVPLPDADFDKVRTLLASRVGAWTAAIAAAEESAAGPVGSLLTFNPEPFTEATVSLASAERYFERLEREVTKQEAGAVAEGDPERLRGEILAALELIAVAPQAAGSPPAAQDISKP